MTQESATLVRKLIKEILNMLNSEGWVPSHLMINLMSLTALVAVPFKLRPTRKKVTVPFSSAKLLGLLVKQEAFLEP